MKSDPDEPPLSRLGGVSSEAPAAYFRVLLELLVSPFGSALLTLLVVATALVLLLWGWDSVAAVMHRLVPG